MESISMRMRMMAVAAVSIILLQGSAAAATQHVVGGTAGWTIPANASFYSDWAAAQTFATGDALVFNFTTGAHNVMQVGKAGYDGCSSQGAVGSTLTTGPATVTLKSAGAHYYICGVPTHCSFGQKLAVNVSAAAAGPAAPSEAPGPSAPPPGGPAPKAPTPPSAPAPASPGAAPPPGGSSAAAAPPSGSAVWLLALLAAAAAAAAGGFAQH